MIQDASYDKRIKIEKKKCESKKVKAKFSEWKNITNVPDLR